MAKDKAVKAWAILSGEKIEPEFIFLNKKRAVLVADDKKVIRVIIKEVRK